MSKESSSDGVLTRALELYGRPVENVDTAHQLHLVSENNYGFAGRIFLEYLIDMVLKVKGKFSRDFTGYLCFRTWEQIAVEMNYDLIWVHCLHNRSLNKIKASH